MFVSHVSMLSFFQISPGIRASSLILLDTIDDTHDGPTVQEEVPPL